MFPPPASPLGTKAANLTETGVCMRREASRAPMRLGAVQHRYPGAGGGPTVSPSEKQEAGIHDKVSPLSPRNLRGTPVPINRA